jgi:hypothetical protein
MSEQKTNSFSIIEILQYVRKNSQTGRLLFEEKGTRLAELFFNKGHLVHALNSRVTGDDVVYQLLGNKTAEIRWERNIPAPQETVSKTDEVLLLGALGILTEDDAASVMNMVSQEAEQAMASTFANSAPAISEPIQPLAEPMIPPVASASPPVAPPVAPVAPPVAPAIPAMPPAAAVAPSASPSPSGPLLGSSNVALESMGRLQAMLGDEVLRPPRFRRWAGLPLPFVSAYAFDPSDRQVKTSYDLLWREKFSGIMACVFGQIEGLIMLYRGRAVHSRFAEGRTFFKDQNALRRIVELTIPPGEKNVVLIYPLEPEFIHSYAALIMGEPELTGLSSQSVKINKLLNTLEQAQRTGVVHVSNNNEENGFIFLHSGHKLGSYYEVEDVLEESILRVYQIVGKSGSVIDVLTSPPEDRLFEYASRPKSAAELKQQIIEIAHEIFGKRSSRVVQLISQAEDNAPALKTYCNQARRVAQMFIDRNLADQFYERAMFLLQELN